MKFNYKEFIFIARNKVQPAVVEKKEEREEREEREEKEGGRVG